MQVFSERSVAPWIKWKIPRERGLASVDSPRGQCQADPSYHRGSRSGLARAVCLPVLSRSHAREYLHPPALMQPDMSNAFHQLCGWLRSTRSVA